MATARSKSTGKPADDTTKDTERDSRSADDAKTSNASDSVGKHAKGSRATYTDSAASLAADARDLAEKMRDDLTRLAARCQELSEVPAEASDGPALDAARRIPMSIDDTTRALTGLVSAAANLARKAVR